MDIWDAAANQLQLPRKTVKNAGFGLMYGSSPQLTDYGRALTVAKMLLRECMEDGERDESILKERFEACWETEDNKFWPEWGAGLVWTEEYFATSVLDVQVTWRSAVDRLGDVTREEG